MHTAALDRRSSQLWIPWASQPQAHSPRQDQFHQGLAATCARGLNGPEANSNPAAATSISTSINTSINTRHTANPQSQEFNIYPHRCATPGAVFDSDIVNHV
jgi:hypothetical protein